jgi:hypothetical protein
LVLSFVRLGPAMVYATGALFAASMILLAAFPSSPWSWALYLTLLPVLRLPAFMLLSLGVEAWHFIAVLTPVAACGVYFALCPQRFPKARFIHAHAALLVLIVANIGANSPQSSGLGPLPLGAHHWSLPIPTSLLGTTLITLAAIACLSSHAEIIRRVREHRS